MEVRDDSSRLRGLRIVHLIETDAPGGAERMLVHMITELEAAGCHNVVVLPRGGEGWISGQLAGTGATTEYFELDRPVSPDCARWLVSLFRRQRIAIAHSHEFMMAVYGAWAAWRAGVPHVVTMHGGRYYAGRLRRRLALRAAVAMSGRLVAVSQPLVSQLSHDLWIRPTRITTIANGVRFTPAVRSTLRGELALSDADHLVVAVGNLYPVKGHTHLLEALAQLASTYPQLHVAIAGRGELAGALKRQAADSGLAARVHFLGLRQDIANILAAADVFVLPSLSEGLPLALLEAMFAARPIVATAVGDVPVALAGGAAGQLVPPGDPTALARAIDRLLAQPFEAQQLGHRAQVRATAEYGIERTVQRYAALYERLLANGADARA